jgi:hypothetical protein
MVRGSNWEAAFSDLAVEGPAVVGEVKEVFESYSPFLPTVFSREPVAEIPKVTSISALDEIVQFSWRASGEEARAKNPGEIWAKDFRHKGLVHYGDSAESVSKRLH